MKQFEKDFILEKMYVLIGKKLVSITRLAATGNICFISSSEKKYFLRPQNGFRIRTNNEILIANLDMFEPTKSMEENPSFNWETYNWDVIGFNQYDEWTSEYNKNKENQVVVEDISISDFGDLTIKCSNDVIIELFINSANGDECWRFFEDDSEENHLVVTGQGIEKE